MRKALTAYKQTGLEHEKVPIYYWKAINGNEDMYPCSPKGTKIFSSDQYQTELQLRTLIKGTPINPIEPPEEPPSPTIVERLQNEITVLNGQINALETSVTALERDNEKYVTELDEAGYKINALQKDNAALTSQRDAYAGLLNTEKNLNERLTAERDNLAVEVKSLKKQLAIMTWLKKIFKRK
jgi:hypothetical protein